MSAHAAPRDGAAQAAGSSSASPTAMSRRRRATGRAGWRHGPLLWKLSHQCINLLMQGMAADAKKHKIAVVTLMPGFMRTERVMRMLTTDELKKQFGFDKSESTEYIGRAVAALAADAKVMAKTGKVHFVADLAKEYGFTDADGRSVPRFNPFG